MTMSMEKLKVRGCTIPALRSRDDMVEFHQVLSMFKVQSTPGASSVLSLEQRGPCTREFRMSAESGGPVDPITVIRAARARHLLQCTCRRACHEAARVPHWPRSSQRFLLSLYGHLSTTRWSDIRPPNGERVYGSGLSADWQGVLAGVLLISFAVPVVLTPGAVRSAPIHTDGECSPQ